MPKLIMTPAEIKQTLKKVKALIRKAEFLIPDYKEERKCSESYGLGGSDYATSFPANYSKWKRGYPTFGEILVLCQNAWSMLPDDPSSENQAYAILRILKSIHVAELEKNLRRDLKMDQSQMSSRYYFLGTFDRYPLINAS